MIDNFFIDSEDYLISPEVRREFYQHCLDIYTGKIDGEPVYNSITGDIEYLFQYGFCLIFARFFKRDIKFWLLPELSEYKPTVFYSWDGVETKNDCLFWFPRGQNKERIEMLEKILASDF